MESRIEDIKKEVFFPEPLFSEYLEQFSNKVRYPFDSWVKVSSDEYVKYLRTETPVVTEDHKKALQSIRDFRDTTLLTFIHSGRNKHFDSIDIIADNSDFRVHRLIAAAFIPKLRDTSQTDRLKHVVKLSGVPKDAIECLIGYMYTGEVRPTRDNFINVFELSIRVGMIQFAEKWVDAFESTKSLRALKLLFWCRIARIYSWKEYVIRLNRSLALEFENLILTEEFLHLNDRELVDILQENKIGTQDEIVVFLGAIKWLNHDWGNRKKFSVQIMKAVRLHEMSKEELLACYNPPILQQLFDIKEIKSMIQDVFRNRIESRAKRRIYCKVGAPNLRLWITDSQLNKLKTKINERETLRKDLNGEAKTFDAQPFEGKHWTSDYDSKARQQLIKESVSTGISVDKEKLTEPPIKETTTKFDITADFKEKDKDTATDVELKQETEKQKIEVKQIPIQVEQKQDSEPSASPVIQSSPPSSSISTYPSTPDYLVNVSPTVSKPVFLKEEPVSLLAFGDYYESKKSAFIFRCDDLSTFVWKNICPLPTHRTIPLDSVIVSDLKNIYCVGGIVESYDRSTGLLLSACNKFYKYELKTYKLVKMKSMENSRVMHSVVLLKNQLFVIGGRPSKNSICSSIEVFDFQKNEWRNATDMKIPRFGCASTVFKKRIFIFGGITQESDGKQQLLSDCVVYNPFTNVWLKMREPLPRPVAFASVVCNREDIYLIGGRVKKENSPHLKMSDKVYCFNGMKWKELPSLNKARCHMVCFSYRRKIFAIGGSSNKENRVNICEVLNTEKLKKGWKQMHELPIKTAGNMITTVSSLYSE